MDKETFESQYNSLMEQTNNLFGIRKLTYEEYTLPNAISHFIEDLDQSEYYLSQYIDHLIELRDLTKLALRNSMVSLYYKDKDTYFKEVYKLKKTEAARLKEIYRDNKNGKFFGSFLDLDSVPYAVDLYDDLNKKVEQEQSNESHSDETPDKSDYEKKYEPWSPSNKLQFDDPVINTFNFYYPKLTTLRLRFNGAVLEYRKGSRSHTIPCNPSFEDIEKLRQIGVKIAESPKYKKMKEEVKKPMI